MVYVNVIKVSSDQIVKDVMTEKEKSIVKHYKEKVISLLNLMIVILLKIVQKLLKKEIVNSIIEK